MDLKGRRERIDQFFVPENALGSEEHLSPSGKYRLKVTHFQTKPNRWQFTQGLVYRQGSEQPLFEVRRNLDYFFFSWIEDHPNGHHYLICGEDYQGQTVLELDTGRRRDYLPPEAEQGEGFCWSSHKFHQSSLILVVSGCVWATPYEFRFYDFSEPMSGWPEIKLKEWIHEDPRQPKLLADGTIKCYQTERDEDGDQELEYPVAAIRTFRRAGLDLVPLKEWVSQREKQRRIDQAEGRRRFDEWLKTFQSSDPLYLTFVAEIKRPGFLPSPLMGLGVTHEGWCPDFKLEERLAHFRIVKTPPRTVDLEWGLETGPIKLVIYGSGNQQSDKFFPHSVDGMKAALAFALSPNS